MFKRQSIYGKSLLEVVYLYEGVVELGGFCNTQNPDFGN
jgi:hypothetical protein